jgi:hypothetical protein
MYAGTAGVWRIHAMNEAGGWNDRTTVEDMDLAVRASMHGWKFVYLHDLEVTLKTNLIVQPNFATSQKHKPMFNFLLFCYSFFNAGPFVLSLNGKSGKGHLHKRIYYNLKKEKQLDPT